MDGKSYIADQGWVNGDDTRALLQYEVTSCHMTQMEIARALNVSGAKVRLGGECVIVELPADTAANVLSRMFTCHFSLTGSPQMT
jgi:hypothetical protein